MKITRTKIDFFVWAALLLCVVFGGSYWLDVRMHPVSTTAPVAVQKEPIPVRLIIPSIHIDAAIELAGVTAAGVMEAPRTPHDVAWYLGGPIPGKEGSAVIAGHYGWKGGRAAAFDNLSKLKKGDPVTVVDAAGKSSTFIVRDMKTYPSSAIAPEVFVSSNGTHLNLITCGGVWDAGLQSYDMRLVVFTDAAPVHVAL